MQCRIQRGPRRPVLFKSAPTPALPSGRPLASSSLFSVAASVTLECSSRGDSVNQTRSLQVPEILFWDLPLPCAIPGIEDNDVHGVRPPQRIKPLVLAPFAVAAGEDKGGTEDEFHGETFKVRNGLDCRRTSRQRVFWD